MANYALENEKYALMDAFNDAYPDGYIEFLERKTNNPSIRGELFTAFCHGYSAKISKKSVDIDEEE